MTRAKKIAAFSIMLIFVNSIYALAGPVPDTGQTQSYTDTFGEDSDYMINPQSYTKLDAQGKDLPNTASTWAMVRDNVTGLIWEVKTEDGSIHDKDNNYTWYDAHDVFIEQLNGANFGGYSDWRLPTIKELSLIVNSGTHSPAINTDYFPNTASSYYWSSTTYAYDPGYAWRVHFPGGHVGFGKSYAHYVRAVRGGQSSNAFVVNGNGTVTDTSTGLMWQRKTGGPMTWEAAIIYCEGLTLGGYSDWRLPNRNELHSLVDYTTIPSIDTTAFPDPMSLGNWSSTTSVGNPDYAWHVSFVEGHINNRSHKSQSHTFYVLAVRGGQPGPLDDLVILNLSVYDSKTGDPLEGAHVTIGDEVGTTDHTGLSTFSDLALEEYVVEIEATGYVTYSTSISLTKKGTTRLRYGLFPDTEGDKPEVVDVVSYCSNRNKDVFFLDEVDFNVTFNAIIDWNGKTPDAVLFITPWGTYDEPAGSHTFNVGQDFGPGGRLEVVAISQDGGQSDPFDAHIEVMPLPPGMLVAPSLKYSTHDFTYEHHLTFGLITTIISNGSKAVPEEIPLFGGKEISFDPKAEIKAIVQSDGSVTYSLVKVKENEDALKMAGVAFDTGWKLGGDIVFQYDEKDDAWHLDGGHIVFAMSAEKSIGPAYTVVAIGPLPVLVCLRGELGAEVDGTLGVIGWDEGAGWQLDGTLEPGASGKAIAEAGHASVLAVGGYLGINAGLLFAFPVEPTFREASIAMSGGITVTTHYLKYENPLWEYKWSWQAEAPYLRMLSGQKPFIDIREVNWRPIPREYTSGLPLNGSTRTVLRTLKTYLAGTEQTLPYQTDIYPYSYPYMIPIGDDLLLAWITDDLTKTENNRTSLAFSKYSDNQWSNPIKIAEDGTADFYPCMAPMNAGAVVAWQDSGIVFGDDAVIDDILAQQEISVCIYNDASSSWEASTRLTSNTYLDRSPLVAASHDKGVTVWISNEQNDMLGFIEKPNSLKCSLFNATSWSPEATIASGLNAIIKSALTYHNDYITYVFVMDNDGDISTLADQDLFGITFDGTSWSEVVRLTEDNVQDTNPQLAYDQNGDMLLVWYKDGNFMMAKNLDMANCETIVDHEPSSGAADFRLATGDNGQVSIVWPDSSPKGQDIYMAMYDPALNIWGKGIMLTDTNSMERSLTAAQTKDGDLAIVYNRTEMIMTTRQVDVGSRLVDVEVPEAGTTDLCMAMIPIEGDLAVNEDAICVTPEEMTSGGTLNITATISNIGLKAAENIPVAFYYGNPAEGGIQIGSTQIIQGPIASGSRTDVTGDEWPVPEEPDSNKDIYVVVDPDLSYPDRDRSNNVAHVSVFKPDIAISQMYWQAVGPVKRAVTLSVKNVGIVSVENVILVINKEGPSGSLLYEEAIISLGVNETKDIVYVWGTTGEQTSDGYLDIYAEVNRGETIPETSYLNNTRRIQVLGPLPGVILNPSIPSGTAEVPLNPMLDWDDTPEATSYDLYLWKEGEAKPEIPTVAGLTNSQYLVSPNLLPLTTYVWQVVAKNNSGEREGPEWTFTTYAGIDCEINLSAGWSMISLPVEPLDAKLSTLFPDAKVIYGYKKGIGYVRVQGSEELEVGQGYWILMNEDQNYVLTGQPIGSYTIPIDADGWLMIGGCTQSAKVFPHACDIGVIYGYVQGAGYQRVTASQPLEPCKGYWILLNNVANEAAISVEKVD